MSLFQHRHYASATSTQIVALEAAQQDDAGNLWITTDVQTAGRGRMGRVWESKAGNLFASVLIRNIDDMHIRQGLPFLAGLAVYDAVAPLLSDIQRAHLHLKWPNDVLWNGAKLAGILIEVHSSAQHSGDIVIIGFGMNVTHAPEVEGRAVACLADLGIKTTAMDIFKLLANCFEARWYEFQRTTDFAALLNAWRVHSLSIGETLRVNTYESQLIGTYQGVDETGVLLLQLPDGAIERITAADVSLFNER